MDLDLVVQGVKDLVQEVQTLFRGSSVDTVHGHSRRMSKLLPLFAPALTAVIFYHYIKYLLVFNAYQYEVFVKKRCGYLRKLSRQLRHLAKRYGNFYFCYMPMNHGTALPRTYSLFMAIKEVLVNSNRPATRVLRTNLLLDLVHGDHQDDLRQMNASQRDILDGGPEDMDPLFEYNLDIMKCSRELIIQGVKDFDVMSTVYRVMETVVEEMEE